LNGAETKATMLPSLQSMLSLAFCAMGAAIIVIGNRQFRIRDINKIPLVSPRGKHVIGIFLILVAIVVFISQFVVGPRKGGSPSLRRPMFGLTELHDRCALGANRSGYGCPVASVTHPKTSSA
jgi:hypothetical protein